MAFLGRVVGQEGGEVAGGDGGEDGEVGEVVVVVCDCDVCEFEFSFFLREEGEVMILLSSTAAWAASRYCLVSIVEKWDFAFKQWNKQKEWLDRNIIEESRELEVRRV